MRRYLNALTISMIFVGVVSSASAMVIDSWDGSSDLYGDPDVFILSKGNVGANNIKAGNVAKIETPDGGRVEITAKVRGVQVANEGAATFIGDENADFIKISAVGSADHKSYVASIATLAGADAYVDGRFIEITANGAVEQEARGLSIGGSSGPGSNVQIGSDATEKLVIDSQGSISSMGVFSLRSNTTLQAKEIQISTNGWYGVLVQNNTQSPVRPDDGATLKIKGDRINITSGGSALMAFSNGELEVEGDLTAVAQNVVDVRGNSSTKINVDGLHKTVLKGDVLFETPYTPSDPNGSGNLINADVHIGLHGDGSVWVGRAYQQFKGDDGAAVDSVELDNNNATFGNVDGFKVDVSNGGVWRMTGSSFVNDISVCSGGTVELAPEAVKFNVDSMNLNGGELTMRGGADQVVSVNDFSGSGTLNMHSSTSDGKIINTGTFKVVKNVDEGSILNVNYVGITADDVIDPEKAMQSLADSVSANGVKQVKTIAEGDVKGSITQVVDENGAGSVIVSSENKKLGFAKRSDVLAFSSWTRNLNGVDKRFDQLNANPYRHGAWVLLDGSNLSFDGEDLKYVAVHLGADQTFGDWLIGGSLSYSDGEISRGLEGGDADADSYTASMYALKKFDSGVFALVSARYGRLSNTSSAEGVSYSFDNNAVGIEAGLGRTFEFAEKAFVEPSVRAGYSRVFGADYKTSSGASFEQEDYESLNAGVGVRVGYRFPNDSGELYGRAFVGHELLGSYEAKAIASNGVSEVISADVDGTWLSYGVGARFNFSRSINAWSSLSRTSGGDVESNYSFDIGLQYEF